MRIALTCSLLAALAAVASAQEVVYESITDTNVWTLNITGTNFKRGVTNTKANFGKVDQITSTTSYNYQRQNLILDAGTYIAVVRYSKITNASGTEPINMQAVSVSGRKTLSVPIAEQKVDTFQYSRALIFSVAARSPVLLSFGNTVGSTTKQNYLFDSFHVGGIEDKALVYESIGRRWGFAWKNSVHWQLEGRDKTSPFGFSANIPNIGSNLWWMAMGFKTHTIAAPGTYTANVRFRQAQQQARLADFDVDVQTSIDAGKSWQSAVKNKWTAAQQQIGKKGYALSPNWVFTTTQKDTMVRFRWQHICCFRKVGYYADAFMIREGTFTAYGKSCPTSVGPTALNGTIPQLGCPFTMTVDSMPTGGVGSIMFGGIKQNLDLTGAGFPGCFLLTTPAVVFGVPAKNGVGTFTSLIPNNAGLLGGKFFNQAIVLDSKVKGGAASTNGREALIQG